jgi:hypothetical protein
MDRLHPDLPQGVTYSPLVYVSAFTSKSSSHSVRRNVIYLLSVV